MQGAGGYGFYSFPNSQRLLSGTDTVHFAGNNGTCWITPVTGGLNGRKEDFVVGNIQDACIIGLDLLEQWDTVVDMAAQKLRTRFGTVELGGFVLALGAGLYGLGLCYWKELWTNSQSRAVWDCLLSTGWSSCMVTGTPHHGVLAERPCYRKRQDEGAQAKGARCCIAAWRSKGQSDTSGGVTAPSRAVMGRPGR